jgi:DNA invertase Pin-like site-specific DNA recombinase
MPGRAGGVAPGGRTATYTESTLYRIIERTGRGRADAKAKGVKFGRKPKLTPHQQREALERLAQDETQRSVARSYNVSQATISRLRA